ncbi:MAG: ferrous iron transport protein A [Pirellulaceae bacterium]|jgi:ferrous iron transport protein A
MRLDELQKGETAVISEILGDDSLTMRLCEMGLLEGEPIEMIGAAPLGDPLEFCIRGYRLSLRKSEAARVQVNPRGD